MSGRFLETADNARVRIKFCGMTRPEDAALAAALGVDAIGLVFYAPSPRAVTAQAAVQVVSGLPAEVTRVGLFVDAPPEAIRAVLEIVPLDLLQFHGREPAAACRLYNLPYLKALRPGPQGEMPLSRQIYHDAFGILWDTYDSQLPGGSGRVGDWSHLPPVASGQKFILAGGLEPDNVARAIMATTPDAVDVSSGIESAPGIKSSGRMQQFIEEVRNAGT